VEERTVRVIGEAGRGSRGARYWSVFLGALTLGFLAIALLLLALHFISYAKAKAFFDWYVAAHGVSGNAGNYLTQEAFHRLSGRLPIAAGVFGICGVTLALFKRKLARFLLAIPSEWTESVTFFSTNSREARRAPWRSVLFLVCLPSGFVCGSGTWAVRCAMTKPGRTLNSHRDRWSSAYRTTRRPTITC